MNDQPFLTALQTPRLCQAYLYGQHQEHVTPSVSHQLVLGTAHVTGIICSTPDVVYCADSCLLCRAQLSTAQIVEQVVEALRLASRESKAAALGLPGAAPLPPITNIVFMGMGEPLHNLSAVMSAVEILCDSTGLQFSHNKVCTAVVESSEQSMTCTQR